jgi:hypothetical protein
MEKYFVYLFAMMAAMLANPCQAAPSLSKGTSIRGATAYQDSQDLSQFYYIPLSSEATLGDRLKTFEVKYFGMGRQFLVRQSNGAIKSKAGAIVSGTFVVDLSDAQRAALLAQITKDFGVANPKLLPISIVDPKLESVVMDQITGFGDVIQQKWATGFAIGSESAFSVGSLNSGFAQVAANFAPGGNPFEIHANPAIGVNILGKAEFVGDPWTAEIKCDLTQVWSQVRSSASVSASWGWFRLGRASYNSIVQDLQKNGACKFNMTEGSMDTAQFGRPVFEMMKAMFEEMNRSAIAGEGYFKFEPNPEAPAVGGGGGGGGLFGWSVSVNGGYSSAAFTQGRRWDTTVSYTGRVMIPITLGTALAVSCSAATAGHFVDLGDSTEPCIVQSKINAFQKRTEKEGLAKTAELSRLNQQLLKKEISLAEYVQLKLAIDDMVFSDDSYVAKGANFSTFAANSVVEEATLKEGIFYSVDQAGRNIKSQKIDASYKLLKPSETLNSSRAFMSK